MSNELSTSPVDVAAVDRLLESFARTTEEIFSLEELKTALLSGRQLVLKFGADVTAPHLHLGHAVNLWMYRELQELGHKFLFLIGDFTTGIGDPTGRNKLRPIIPDEEIAANADEFIRQVKMVLIDDPKVLEIRKNSEWLGAMSAKELLSLMSMVTHDKLMARDMFRRRVEEGKPIYENELIYPILQGYDSVALKADLTIIGSDQLYNEMMGRFLQEKFGQPPQIIITSRITPGIDGGEKQSKSIGNYIGLSHSPRDKFGRAMTIPDSLIVVYLEVYTKVPMEEIREVEKQLSTDPMGCKIRLAKEIVARYHGEAIAQEEQEWFHNTFSRKHIPDDIPTVTMTESSATSLAILRACFSAEEKSNSELKRLLKQGALKIDGNAVDSEDALFHLPPEGLMVKVGKRNWFKVTG